MTIRLGLSLGITDVPVDSSDGVNPSFTFNGTNQYATMASWEPRGLPFEVNATVTPLTLDATPMRICGASHSLYKTGSNGALEYYNGTGAATLTVSAVDWVLGEAKSVKSTQEGTGGLLVGDFSGTTNSVATAKVSATSVDAIAAYNSGGAQYWHGPISSVALIDRSPIQNTNANIGDGALYGTLDQPIKLSGDFEIEWEGIRQDQTGTGLTEFLGDSATADRFVLYDSGATNSDRFIAAVLGRTLTYDNAFANIAQGQHYTAKFTKLGNDHILSIDGVDIQSVNANDFSPFVVSQLYSARNVAGRTIPTDSAMQNLVITDVDNQYTWEYPLTPAEDPEVVSGPALVGNGARYISIPTFTVPAGEDFVVEWDAIFQKGNQHIVGDGISEDSRILIFNSTTNLSVYMSGAAQTFTGAMADLEVGQHYSARLTRTITSASQGMVTLEIDGVEKTGPGAGVGSYGAFFVGNIGSADGGTFSLLTDSALQNVTLHNTSTGDYVKYKVDEGVVLDVLAYDINGDAIGEGDELVDDDFASADWGASDEEWVRTSESASITSATSVQNLRYTSIITDNATYDFIVEVAERLGTVNCSLRGVLAANNLAVGTNTFRAVSGSSSTPVNFRAASGASVVITAVSLRQVSDGTITPDADWQQIEPVYYGTGIQNVDPSTQGNFLEQPLWDTTALIADGARYIEIPEFSTPIGDDWEISFDWIRQDRLGTSVCRLMGATGSSITVNDTGNAAPDNFVVATLEGAAAWVGALSGIALGSHDNYRVRGTSTSTELFVNDVSLGFSSVQGRTGILVNQLYAYGSANMLPANSAMQNVTLHNLTTGEYVQYKTDEGSGLDVLAYDINGDAIGEGPDIVVNGTFPYNVNDWSENLGAVVSWDNGAMSVQRTAGSTDAGYQLIPTIEGETYELTFDITDIGGSTGGWVRVSGSVGAGITASAYLSESALPVGSHTFRFLAQATEPYLCFGGLGGGTSTQVYDNIIVKQVSDGTITPDADWQDTGSYSSGGEFTDSNWTKISDNSRIYAMTGGSSTLPAVDATGTEVPAAVATIQNYTDEWS